MNPKIPSTIADPFPDNASRPFWAFKDKKSLADEFFDCYVSFKELNCHEYFWEWQSRNIDESLMKKLAKSYRKFFSSKPIGKERFITFVVNNDNIKELGKLYMSIILSNEFAKETGLHAPPLFEVVHPVAGSDSLLHFIDLYSETVSIACDKMDRDVGPKQLFIIPTHNFKESSSEWFASLHRFISDYQQRFRTKLKHIRPLISRRTLSDSKGFVGSVLATKRMLSNYHAFAKIEGIKVFPILQVSVLPFRGGLIPDRIKEFVATYKGVRSVTISSSFRYDFKTGTVIDSIKALNRGLHRVPSHIFSKDEGKRLKHIEDIFTSHYKKALSDIPDLSRITAKKDVPESIERSFALYSLGIPPEFIGIGSALLEIIKSGRVKDLEELYPEIKSDLVFASRLLNRENLNILAKTHRFWARLKKDVSLAEDFAGPFGPSETDDFLHRNLSSNILHKMLAKRDFSDDLSAAAKVRHSLG